MYVETGDSFIMANGQNDNKKANTAKNTKHSHLLNNVPGGEGGTLGYVYHNVV